MQIAPEHPETIGERSRVSVEKRLLLDRIALHSADVPPGNVEFSTTVIADFADPRLPFGNWAAMPASEAANAVPFNLLVEFALADVLVKNFLKGRQRVPLVSILERQKASKQSLEIDQEHASTGAADRQEGLLPRRIEL